jgi:hypothetical protein
MLADAEKTTLPQKIEFMNRLMTEADLVPTDLNVQEFENLLDIMLFFIIDAVDGQSQVTYQ